MDDKIFNYCERGLDPGFWAEPINAVTNAAFVIAGLAAFYLLARQPAGSRRLVDYWLAALVCIIGIGSFLFHTYATPWAGLADVLPIAIMMLSYLTVALRRYLGATWLWTGVGLVVFVVAYVLAGQILCDGERCLNGSLGYFPAFIALMLIGGWLVARGDKPTGWGLLAAAGVFAVSLAFRSVDFHVCDHTHVGHDHGPLGTHFMWHVLNAVMLYILVRVAIRFERPKTA
ncbi:MAG: ceramidase domain-containing protein [Pseudomonadota bacterium]